jgi:hypothetical protein
VDQYNSTTPVISHLAEARFRAAEDTPLLGEEGCPKGGVVAHKSHRFETDHPGASRHSSCSRRGFFLLIKDSVGAGGVLMRRARIDEVG